MPHRRPCQEGRDRALRPLHVAARAGGNARPYCLHHAPRVVRRTPPSGRENNQNGAQRACPSCSCVRGVDGLTDGNRTRRQRGYEYERSVARRLNETPGCAAYRLGGAQVELPDVLCINNTTNEMAAIECKTGGSGHLYVPREQIERCRSWTCALRAYGRRHVIVAFRFHSKRGKSKTRRGVREYFFRLHDGVMRDVRCAYDGTLCMRDCDVDGDWEGGGEGEGCGWTVIHPAASGHPVLADRLPAPGEGGGAGLVSERASPCPRPRHFRGRCKHHLPRVRAPGCKPRVRARRHLGLRLPRAGRQRLGGLPLPPRARVRRVAGRPGPPALWKLRPPAIPARSRRLLRHRRGQVGHGGLLPVPRVRREEDARGQALPYMRPVRPRGRLVHPRVPRPRTPP